MPFRPAPPVKPLGFVICVQTIERLWSRLALLKGLRGVGEEHEVVGQGAEDEFAGLGRTAARGQR